MYLLNNKLGRFINIFSSEQQISHWLTGGTSVVSGIAFLNKKPSFVDVRNHLDLIGSILHNDQVVLTKQQTRILSRNLLDYATNEVYTFRGNQLYSAVERIAAHANLETLYALFEAFLVKQSEIYDRPIKATIDEDGKKELNSELKRRIFNCLKLLLEQLVKVETDFTYDKFALILQTISHPVTCCDKRSLKKSFSAIEKLFTREKLAVLIDTHVDRIIEQFLRRRTGVLSENLKVRHIAKNVLVIVGWAGQIEKLLPQMVHIFDYKPIQKLNKME